jgi:hypothetical protein
LHDTSIAAYRRGDLLSESQFTQWLSQSQVETHAVIAHGVAPQRNVVEPSEQRPEQNANQKLPVGDHARAAALLHLRCHWGVAALLCEEAYVNTLDQQVMA